MRRAAKGPFVSSPDAKHAVLLQLWNTGCFQQSCPGTGLAVVTQNTCTGAQANQMFSRKAKHANRFWGCLPLFMTGMQIICWCSLNDYHVWLQLSLFQQKFPALLVQQGVAPLILFDKPFRLQTHLKES